MLKVFCALGLLYSFWVLSNGTNVLLSENLLEMIIPFMPQTLVCVVPAVLLVYILHFTGSRFAKKAWVIGVLVALSFFDLLMLWTNPLHHEFVTRYEGFTPVTGSLFPVHAVISYVPVILAVVFLYRYIIKNAREKPFLGIVGAGMSLPLILNILYTFQIFDVGFDLTPFAFIIMYGTFTVYSIKMRLFDIKETTASEIFDTLSDALMVVDRAGIVMKINPAFHYMFPDLTIVVDETHINEVANYIRSVSTELVPPEIYHKLFSNEPETVIGTEITISAGDLQSNYSFSKDIMYDRGHYTGYIITVIDISNYRQIIDVVTELKIQADSASSAKGLFLSHMSHEIRTPLNAIIGMISIGMRTDDIDKKNYSFERADSASKHLLGIINDILDMSKIEANKFELSYGELSFEKMLTNIVNVVNVRVEEKRQNLVINLSGEIPDYVESDELHLSQVITNLLTNAIKFTPDGGTITLDIMKTEETGSEVMLRVEVTDTGIGISKEQQERLFTSFNQADAGITKRFGGTGLGLAISKRIVELMGGRIWIESELGSGAKFIFTMKAGKLSGIPRAKPAVGALTDDIDFEPSEAPGSVPGRALKRSCDLHLHTILIAEDVDINREIMSAILEETKVAIDFAENGKIAVDIFRRQPWKYSLILMDVSMPEMDGYEATRAIRAIDSECAKRIPIIAMTAHVFKEDIEKCLESGMNDHTGKPIDANALIGLLRNYLTRYYESKTMKNVYELDSGIAWDDSLLTGNTIVDMQHQKLFERLSELVDLCESGNDTVKLHDTLSYLLNHAIRHFTDEEALQLEYDYPDYEEHRLKHDEFKKTICELFEKYEISGSSHQLSQDVNKIVIRWLVNHIQHDDMGISEHIRNTIVAQE